MTRIVRFEELNGELILRVPADMAERLGFAAGDEALMKDADRTLTVEPALARARDQRELMTRIIEEDDAVLAVLAK